jgi:hypothetical protein
LEATIGAVTSRSASEEPLYFAPLPSVTEPAPSRSCVPAATVVIHGLGCATVLVVGPALPAEAATNTPASAAYSQAISTGSRKLVCVPLIEKLMTSTPSATAWSIAATLSVVKQPALAVPPTPQQTLYAAMRARGAMPLMLPSAAAEPVTFTFWLPPAVDAVWVPWPS